MGTLAMHQFICEVMMTVRKLMNLLAKQVENIYIAVMVRQKTGLHKRH